MAALSRSTPRIFISHSHKDNEFGIKLVHDLRRVLGDENTVWYDARGGLNGGDIWWDKITKELRRRNTFIVLLSPNALKSGWVKREISIAWARHVANRMAIVPVLFQTCNIPVDLKTIQHISFLPPKTYETAFQELLTALKLPSNLDIKKLRTKPEGVQPDGAQQMVQRIQVAFSRRDWSYVIEKVHVLIDQRPEALSASLSRMLGLDYLYTGKPHRAQNALGTALSLVTVPEKRLRLLDEYTGPSITYDQWEEVLSRSKEALQLAPNGPTWKVAQEVALAKLDQKQYVLTAPAYHDEKSHYHNGTNKLQVRTKEAEVRQDEVKIGPVLTVTEHDQPIEVRNVQLEVKRTLLELERLEVEVREARLQCERKQVISAIEIGDWIAEKFYPGSNTKVKANLSRIFLQNLIQFGMSKAVEIALSGIPDIPEETNSENM